MRKNYTVLATTLLLSLSLSIANAADGFFLSTISITPIKPIPPTIDSLKHNDNYFLNRRTILIEREKAISIEAQAKNGDKIAQKALADMYREGRGVIKNDAVALMWYIISDKNGVEEADRDLSLTKSYMASDQINLAQKMASKWLTTKD